MSFIDTLMRASAARDQYDWMKPLNLTRHQERTVKRETEAMTRKRQDYAVQLTAAMIINILADKYNGNEYIPDILANLRKMCEEAGEGEIEWRRDIMQRMDVELANNKHAEDAYIAIIDKLKRRIEHECVAWHSADEFPENDDWVIAAIDGAAKGKIYDKCIEQVEIDHYNKRLYDEDIDVTELVRYWCYEPEWPEEDEE